MNIKTEPTDQELIAGCINGDKALKEFFVRKFSDAVYMTVNYTLKSKNATFSQLEAEDLQNTIFIKLFERNSKKQKN